METVSIVPIPKASYDKNLLKCVCLFKAYNTSPHLKLSMKKNDIYINILRSTTVLRFVLVTPFYYPHNFDYFELCSTDGYKDNSSVILFLNKINEYLKTIYSNNSLGQILEYINKHYEMISKNIEIIKSPETEDESKEDESKEDEPKEDDILTEPETINTTVPVVSPISDNVEKQPVHLDNSYFCFYNRLTNITPKNYHLYILKNKKMATCTNILELEMIFNQILKISEEATLLFDNSNPDLYSFTIIKEQLFTYDFSPEYLTKKKKLSRKRKKLKQRIISQNRRIVKIKPTSKTQIIEKKIEMKYIVTIIDLQTINIYPISPVFEKNVILDTCETGSIIDTINKHIEIINLNKLNMIKSEYKNISLFPLIFNIIKYSIHTVSQKNRNKNIKLLTKYLESTDIPYRKLLTYFYDYGWDNNLECKKYIINVINNLKIADYALNRKYYYYLMQIVHEKWFELKLNIDLTCFTKQYNTLLLVRPEKIDIFEKIINLADK